MNLSVVVLAAGEGTRMASELPKVMHPLAGRPMISSVVEAGRNLEPTSLTVIVGNGADLVSRTVGDDVRCVTQAERLGTGHAVRQAEQFIAGQAETVLVLYGDTPLIRPKTLRLMLQHHDDQKAAVTLLAFQVKDPSGYGRIVRDRAAGQVQRVAEEADASPEQRLVREVSGGVFCFHDPWLWKNLARIEREPGREIHLTDLVAMACSQGQTVATLAVDDPREAIGLDNRLELAEAEAEMRRRINTRWMLAGVTLKDPESTYIEADVEIGADTVIWPGSLLRGRTRIGRACTIGPRSVIVDSAIGDRCRVELSVVEQAIMEDGSDVGPYSHLRKGAHLGTGTHVGNFGEVKNSYLGPGAKMGHMSYLGDATVGAGANIGAGTITCNFDGSKKHRTTIGEGAFIGSDTMLVAPVEVGDGAKTGAGSVVTRDVPAGRLAYGVPARVRTHSDVEEPEGGQRGNP